MRNYEKLIIPKDSAWNKKGVLPFLWRKTHWRIRYFLGGIKNIFRWAPTLYKDKDWDEWYIFTILQKKIEFQREEIIYANRHMQVDRDNRDMTIVLNLIERVKEEYYGTEHLDYEESKFRFEPVDEDRELYSMEQDIISENYDDYLKKYPSSVRIVLKEKPDLNKKDLCYYVAKHNEKKAHNLLFKILKERMRWWWD